MNFKPGSFNTLVNKNEDMVSILFTHSNVQSFIKYLFLQEPELGKTETTYLTIFIQLTLSLPFASS